MKCILAISVRYCLIILTGISIGCVTSRHGKTSTESASASQYEYASLCSALAELAIQRYEEDGKSGKISILTLQTNNFDFAKYADNDFELVCLPVVASDDWKGFCRYAYDYNECNIKKADLMVQAGQYKQARKIYQLLLRFDPCGLQTPRLKARLLCLDKLEKHEEVSDNIKLFTDNCGCGALTDWGQLRNLKPTFVTNLLMLDLK